MTREEAIRHIESIKPYVGRNIKDALDMATKALEQEPCEELDFIQPHKKMSVNLEVCKMCKNKGVLEQLAEEQNSLLASTKAWNNAIEKNGYVN